MHNQVWHVYHRVKVCQVVVKEVWYGWIKKGDHTHEPSDKSYKGWD